MDMTEAVKMTTDIDKWLDAALGDLESNGDGLAQVIADAHGFASPGAGSIPAVRSAQTRRTERAKEYLHAVKVLVAETRGALHFAARKVEESEAQRASARARLKV